MDTIRTSPHTDHCGATAFPSPALSRDRHKTGTIRLVKPPHFGGRWGRTRPLRRRKEGLGAGPYSGAAAFMGLVRQHRGKCFQLLLRCSVHLLLHSWLAKWLQEQSRPRWAAEADQKQRVLGALGRAGAGRELVLIDPRLILKVRKRKINFGGRRGGCFF